MLEEEGRTWQALRTRNRAVALLLDYQFGPAVAYLKQEQGATGPDIWGAVLREIRPMEVPTGRLRVCRR